MALYLDDVLAQQNTNDALPNPSKPGLQAGTFAQQVDGCGLVCCS